MKIVSITTFFLLSLFCYASTIKAELFHTVVHSDHPVPGMNQGVSYDRFNTPRMNSEGEVVFSAVLEGLDIDRSNREVLMSDVSGSLNVLVRQGDHAAGTNGDVNYSDFGSGGRYQISSNGTVLFQTKLSGAAVGSSSDVGIWSSTDGIVTKVARDGDQIPSTPLGGPSGLYSMRSLDPTFNDIGQVAFRSGYRPQGAGILIGGADNLEVRVNVNDQAPGTDQGAFFSSFSYPDLNSQNQIVFEAELSGFVNSNNNAGIWSGGPGELSIVARKGTHAPGTGPDERFRDFLIQPKINSNGETAFIARLSGSSGIWAERSGSLELVTREGTQAPGTPDGVLFNNFDEIQINDSGRIVTTAVLRGSPEDVHVGNWSGMWSDGFGSMELVVRKGDTPLGIPEGYRIVEVHLPKINAAGQAAFNGGLSNLPNGIRDSFGIWAQDRDGVLQFIAGKGSIIEVAPGDFRTVSDTLMTSMNDKGQIAFRAYFSDGSSGIVVSNQVAVPEPSPLLLILLGSVLCAGYVKQQKRFFAKG